MGKKWRHRSEMEGTMQIRDRIRDLRRVRAGDLEPNPRNWRTHPRAQREALQGVLAEIGYADALLVRELEDGRLRLVDGHLRAETTPDQEVPVLVLDLDDAEEAKLLAILDPLAGMAGANTEALGSLLAELDTESDALQAMLDELAAEHGIERDPPAGGGDPPEPQLDRADELQAQWGTEPGQLWEIDGQAGTHRLLCGDATNQEDVERVMGGAAAGVMVTDPPYGVELDQTWRDDALGDEAMGPGNPNVMANDDRADWTEAWQLFPGDVVYVWHADKYSDVVMTNLRDAEFEICQQLVWNKSVMVMGRSDYHFKHEACWYAVRKAKPHGWIGDRKQTTVIEAKSPNHLMAGSDEVKTPHPTQKPVECFAMFANHGGDVYDPFLGSGTTMVAAEQLGRICYGIEIEPKYVAVTLQRLQDMGLEPKLA
jgi:DNA modification methylase